MLHCSFGSSFRSGLRCIRRRFSRASKAQSAGACPAECITLYIGNGYNGVIKGGLDMSRAAFDVFLLAASAGGFFGYGLPSQLSLPKFTSSC